MKKLSLIATLFAILTGNAWAEQPYVKIATPRVENAIHLKCVAAGSEPTVPTPVRGALLCDSADGSLRYYDGSAWQAVTGGGGGGGSFAGITTGTNTTATMTCGTGCTINSSGSGSIVATSAATATTASAVAFSGVSGATNTSAALVVGTGASLSASGSGTIVATSLASTLGETAGGTGTSTYTAGDLLYSDSVNSLAKLPIGSDGEVLTLSSGLPVWAASAGAPAFSDITTATNTTATMTCGTGCAINSSGSGTITATSAASASAVAFSGVTGATNTTAALVVGTGASLGVSGSGTINSTTLLGATWAAPNAIGSGTPAAGTFTTLSVTTTPIGETSGGTGQSTYATGDILYSSASNTLAKLAAGSDGEVLTLASGIPSWAAAGGSSAFSDLTSGTNTAAAMVVGTGASLGVSGSGTNTATTLTSTGNDTSANLAITQNTATSGTPTAPLRLTGAAHTTLAAGTEATDVLFALNRTVQFATGALTTQRAMRITAPTYGFVGASTITNAATLSISGAPAVGTNATITNSYALWVQSGSVLFNGTGGPSGALFFRGSDDFVGIGTLAPTDKVHIKHTTFNVLRLESASANNVIRFVNSDNTEGKIDYEGKKFRIYPNNAFNSPLVIDGTVAPGNVGMGTTSPSAKLHVVERLDLGTKKALLVQNAAHTTLTTSTEFVSAEVDMSATKRWNTALPTTQREFLVRAPTYASSSASTITDAATMAITGAPVAGTNATLTNSYALWVQSGDTNFEEGHLVSTQATAPTTTLTSTTLNDGAGSGATCVVTSGGTDTAGHVTITAGNGTPGAGVACQIVFDTAYVTAPKSVIMTCDDADCTDNQHYVSNRGTASFEISFNAALGTSEVVELNFWVIE